MLCYVSVHMYSFDIEPIKITPTMAQSLLYESKMAFGESNIGKIRAIQHINEREIVHFSKTVVQKIFMGYYRKSLPKYKF